MASITGDRANIDPATWAGPDGGRPVPPPARPPWWLSLLASAAAGGLMLAAFPPVGAWPLAPVAVALLAVAVHRRGVGFGLVMGAVTGAVFFTPLLAWTNLHTGDVPWLLLSGAQAGYVALSAAALAYAGVLVDRWRWLWPPLVGVVWVGQEALRDRVPFGGFPWGRLAFSQAGGPLLRYAAAGGAPLVTFAVATCGGLLALSVWRVVAWLYGRRAAPDIAVPVPLIRVVAAVAAPLLAAVAVAGLGLAVPLAGGSGAGTVTVAVVQGNVPRLGLGFNAQREAVLNDHVDATLALARQVDAGQRPRPALVVWPENSSDIDPFDNPDAAQLIGQAAVAINAPIVVGTVLDGPGDNVRNAALLWTATGGGHVVYVKQHPVPFAEYIPLRSVARLVSNAVDLVPRNFVPGHEPGVIHTGPVTVADVICFEVGYDNIVRDAVNGGGQLLAVQTNNATFNVAEARQQLAMVQERAVETGRTAMMASTVGVSAFVDTHGGVHQATRFNTQAVIEAVLPVHNRRTLAMVLGVWPERVLAGVAVVGLIAAATVRRRGRPAPGR